MNGEAVLFIRKVTKYPGQELMDRYYFSLKGVNGEIIAQSEAYNQKQSAIDTLTTYFGNFDIVDETGEEETS